MLDWIKAEVPLAAGLDTKGDLRAGKPPKLDVARDVWFDEPGGIQTRLPYLAFNNLIFGGGTLANCRRLAVVNDELVVFTDDEMYSWNAQLTRWVLRATHLAVAVAERSMFATTADQIDPDRAELNGTIVSTWTEGTVCFVAAEDKTTGSVLLPPTSIGTASRPRLVATTTRILWTFFFANTLLVRIIDPATPATGALGGSTTVIPSGISGPYDVVRVDAQDMIVGACQRTVTTSYTAFTVTAGGTVATVTKARTADGPLAVSTITGGTQTQVVRANSANIQGDLLTTATLADVFTDQPIGSSATPVNQIAACHRSVQNGGAFRCYVFWTGNHTATGLTWSTINNWVDNAGVIGTPATVALQLAVASRAFDCNGSVFVWLTFGSTTIFASPSGFLTGTTLQNTYFLFRDDAFLCAKSVAGSGGGFPPSTGRLPGVSTISATSFAWCATKRRRFAAGSDQNADFAARTPVDVTFDIDSNEARRMAVIGRTGYLAAGEVLAYDGTRLVECGFHVFPWAVGALEIPGGSLTAGATYAYKGTYRYQNGQGESERSTTATIGAITLTTGTRVDLSSGSSLTATHKLAVVPALEYWRTKANPGTVDAPFFLITSNDPGALTNPNRYVPNDPVAGFAPTVQDVLADTAISSREANPENGDVLESLAPPPARIAISNDTRIFLAGVAGRPDEVWYSRLRGVNEIASFHDTLTIPVPRAGGDITALAFNNETLTVFRESAIYALPGDGLNNLGQGQNYGPARIISSDVGAISQETVALTPLGLVFKALKGWYLLTPGWGLRYIGANVNAFDADTVFAVNVVETQHHVRVVQSGRILIWDYSVVSEEQPLGQWAEWTVEGGIHAVMWQGQHVILTATGPVAPRTEHTGGDFGLDAETTWLKPADQQGEFFLRWIAALGEYRSAHLLRIRLARDYQYDGSGNPVYFDDFAWTPTPTVVGSALQVKHPPSINRMQALKVRITAVTEAVRASLFTGSLVPAVATSGTAWGATWTAVSTLPGEMGNRVTMSLAFESGAANLIDVRDHYAYVAGRWTEDLNNIGVRVVRSSSPPTVAQLEDAIANVSTGTKLATLTTPDATPSKTINVSMVGQTSAQSFAGGAYGSPTGEALKLTSLALEYGLDRGINKRLSASQKAA